jgi:hypothetical protein
MKLIKAIVRPNKVDDVREALEKLSISGLTVTEVRGHGKQKGHTAIYRGKEYQVSLLPKMEIEVVIGDEIADERSRRSSPRHAPVKSAMDGCSSCPSRSYRFERASRLCRSVKLEA